MVFRLKLLCTHVSSLNLQDYVQLQKIRKQTNNNVISLNIHRLFIILELDGFSVADR